MSEPASEELPAQPIKIDSVFQLQPGKLYRLHVHSIHKPDEGPVEVKTEDFYIEKPIDPNEHRFRFGVRINVRKPVKKQSADTDLYSSYYLADLGLKILLGTNKDLTRQNHEPQDKSDAYKDDPDSYANWVEEIGPKP